MGQMIRRNPTRLSHIINRVLQQEHLMQRHVPAHKVIGDVGKPGQIINNPGDRLIAKANADMMDDMGQYAQPKGNTEVSAHAYKPVHGGYPDGR